MAKVCENKTLRRCSKAGYDWDNWLDGQVWELEKGVDFHVVIPSFRNSASYAARKIGLEIKTVSKGNSIFIQAIGEEQ